MIKRYKSKLCVLSWGVIQLLGSAMAESYLKQGLYYQSIEEYGDAYRIPINAIDPTSFVIVYDGLAYDKNNTYYFKKIVNESNPQLVEQYRNQIFDDYFKSYQNKTSKFFADRKSFEHIGVTVGLALDKKRVYHRGAVLKKVKPDQIQVLNQFLFRADNTIYDRFKKISKDAKNFKVLNQIFAKDNNSVFYLSAWDKFQYKALADTDATTFEVMSSKFAKDKRRYFIENFPINGLDYDSAKLFDNYIIDKNRGFFYLDNNSQYRVINDIDYETFVDFGKYYAKDKNHVYFKGRRLLDADPTSFAMNRYGQLYDENGAFWQESKVVGAKGQEFTRLDGHPTYSADGNSVYYKDVEILGADVETFKAIPFIEGKLTSYGMDKNRVYVDYMPLIGADSQTFARVEGDWFKDNNRVFSNGKIVDGLDPVSFRIIDKPDNFKYVIKDNLGVYWFDEHNNLSDKLVQIVAIEDPKTLTELKSPYYKDQDNIYYIKFKEVTKLDADINSFKWKKKPSDGNFPYELESDFEFRDNKGCFVKGKRDAC